MTGKRVFMTAAILLTVLICSAEFIWYANTVVNQMSAKVYPLRRIPERDEDAITLDFAGFRTLDSIVRAKKIFGCSEITVITQPGQLERALYLAEKSGLDAIGFAAREPNFRSLRLRYRTREALARAAAWLDVNLLHRNPKFLGEPVQINIKKQRMTK